MKKVICALLIFALLISVSAGCEKKNNADNPADTLTVAITRDENSLTPMTYVSGTPGIDVMRLIYDSLFTISPDNTVIPCMVEDDYTVSDDWTTYSMTLRSGLKWHDGTDVTGDDVAFTFDYFESTFTYSRWTAISKLVRSVEVSGREITLTLESPNPGFLRAGLADMAIISKSQLDGVTDPTTLPSNGSGAYKLAEYKTGEYYTLEAVSGYFRGTPRVKTIRMPIMDAAAAQQALLAGEIAAYTSGVSGELVETFSANPDIEVVRSDGYASSLLLMNCERAPFDNAGFRRAVSLALDLDQIVAQVMLGNAKKGTAGYVRDGLDEFVPGLDYTFDTGAANALLDEIGYDARDGAGMRLSPDGTPLAIELLTTSSRSRTAELIALQLAAVGLNIKVTALDPDSLDLRVWPDFDTAAPHDYDMATFGWASSLIQRPGAIVGACYSDYAGGGGYNLQHYVNAEFDGLAARYLASTDIAERLDLNEQMQQIAARDIPFVTLYFSDSINAVNTKLYGGWVFPKGGLAVNVFSFLPE